MTYEKRKRVFDLARQKMAEHGLQDWRFEWDSAKRRAGVCQYGKRTIGMSTVWAAGASEGAILDTLLHEIAHALAGHEAGHGPRWRQIARSIGCSAERCATETEHMPKGRYEAVCRSCGRTVAWRWRLTDSIRNATHRSCGRAGTLRWVDHG